MVTDVFRYGHYSIDRACSLGGGSFGQVYKGYDEAEKRDIAVKHITIGTKDFSIDVAMKEVAVLQKVCQHENVVAIYDSFIHGGRPWIVMEFCDGSTLDEYMTQKKPGLSSRVNVIRQIVDAVAYMHNLTSPVAHRDLKPANIIICNGPQAKVCDFGVAKVINEEETIHSVTPEGSRGYMAPELWVEYVKYIPQCADIFSLGLIALAVVIYDPDQQPFAHFLRTGEILELAFFSMSLIVYMYNVVFRVLIISFSLFYIVSAITTCP